MSKICGICQLEPHPVSAHDDAFVRAALQRSGYLAPAVVSAPGYRFGWAAGGDFSRGSGLAASPDRSVCAWDGRLDNRLDLLRECGLSPSVSDSAIVLDLYRRKGMEGLRGAIGDWSLCIWDAGERTLLLATDYAGVRPLYYHRRGGTVYWSSSLSDLVRWTAATDLDEGYAAGFLQGCGAADRTPYSSIAAIAPGHAVSFSREHTRSRAFWSVPQIAEVWHAADTNYEEQLFELFREAVRCRLSTVSPNCAELSGGLDSSSVVCMADRLRKGPGGDFRGLLTFSYTHDHCTDEDFFCEVERACGFSGLHLRIGDYPPVDAAQPDGVSPEWWTPRYREIARRMADVGSSVFLTGQLGDLIMGNTNDDTGQVTDLIAGFRYVAAGREAYAWAKSLGTPIYPILWKSLRATAGAWSPQRQTAEDSLRPEWKVRWSEHGAPRDPAWRHVPPGRREKLWSLHELLSSRALQTPEPLQHVSFAHPFAHRPLVEFMMSIPAAEVCRPGEPRRLMRRAFADLLPPRILRRKSKAAFTTVYDDAVKPMAKEMLLHPVRIQVVERGMVDSHSLRCRLERFTHGLECNSSQLRQVILFEWWLRRYSETSILAPLPGEPVTVN
ncbi:MAG TPA: asparagine synthase-related protein [Candidatus Solibacter sp.]|nr:asparagine synthase-related protein [Candidatus Solibacter sp.]